MNPSEREEGICIRLFINEYKGFIGVKNLCPQNFICFPVQKILRRKTEHCSVFSLFVCFWDFTRKIPNSGIRADPGSLKVIKKLKEGSFCCSSKSSPAK